ncbi:hypothetical protein O9992_21290 [Vibrio lentus]|nr:hypothetical protein [Vibrio lentus]
MLLLFPNRHEHGNVVLLGIVLGGMAGFDMGGPFAEVAFLILGRHDCQRSKLSSWVQWHVQFLSLPLGMAIATRLGRKFDYSRSSEIEADKGSSGRCNGAW